MSKRYSFSSFVSIVDGHILHLTTINNLLMAAFSSHVRLSSGPFDPCACLWLAWNSCLGSYLFVSCIFGPNSPAHIFRPASMEFVNKSSYASIYFFWCLNFVWYLTIKMGQNKLSDPGPQDTWHGTDQCYIWDGACLLPIRHVTSRIDLKLVGIVRNHPSSTRCRLLGSYRSRVSM